MPVPALLMKVPLAALALSPNIVLPAPKPAASLVKMPLPALEVPANWLMPPLPLVVPALLVKDVSLPAVALFVNSITALKVPELGVTKFCVVDELFVIPVPLMINPRLSTVVVNALAPELKMICATVVVTEVLTAVVLDISNVATSDDPLGTV